MEVFGAALPGWAVSLLALALVAVVGNTAFTWWKRAQQEKRARFYESLGPKRKIELSDRPPALASKPRQPQNYVSPRRNDWLVGQERRPLGPGWNAGFQPHLSEPTRRAPHVQEPFRSGPLENSQPSSIAMGYGANPRIPPNHPPRYSPERSQPNVERNDSFSNFTPAAYQSTPRLRPDYVDNIPSALFETPNIYANNHSAKQPASTSHEFEPLGPRPWFADNVNVSSYQPLPPGSRKRIFLDENNTQDRDELRIIETVEETSSPVPKRRRRLVENNEDLDMEIVTTEESLGSSRSGRRIIKRVIKRRVKKPSTNPQQSRRTSDRQADRRGFASTSGSVTPQTGKRKSADRYSYEYEENENEDDVDELDMPAGDGWITRSALKSGKRLRTGKAADDNAESDLPISSKSSRKRAAETGSSTSSFTKRKPQLDDDESEHEEDEKASSSAPRSPPKLQAISTAKGRVKVSQTPKKDSSIANGPIDMLKPPMTTNDADETIRKLISTPSKTPSTEKKSFKFASDDGKPNEVKLFNASSPPDSVGRTKGIKFNAEESASPLAPASKPTFELQSTLNEKGKEPAKLCFSLPIAASEAAEATEPNSTSSASDEASTKIAPVAAFGTPTPAAPSSLKFDFFKTGKLPELSSTPAVAFVQKDDSASATAAATSVPVGFGTNQVVAFSFGGPSADSANSTLSKPVVSETTEAKPAAAAATTTVDAKPAFPSFTFGGATASGLSFGVKPTDSPTEKPPASPTTISEALRLSFSLPNTGTAAPPAPASVTGTSATSATSTALAPGLNFSMSGGFGLSGSSDPAAITSVPAPAFSTGTGASTSGGLKFGASATQASSAPVSSSLSFAAPAASTTTPSFGFGAPASGTAGQPATSGFSFGASTGVVTSTPAVPSFLSQANGTSAGFGTPTPVAAGAAASAVYSFGQPPPASAVSGGFGLTAPGAAPSFNFPGTQATTTPAAPSLGFGTSGSGASQSSSKSGFNFAGGATSSAPAQKGATSSFSFGASAPPASQPAPGTPSTAFTFGTGAPSSFGVSTSQPSFGAATSSSGFSFGQTSVTSTAPAFNAPATSKPSFTAPSAGAPNTGLQSSFSGSAAGAAAPAQQGFSFGGSSFGAGQPPKLPQQSGFSFGQQSGTPAFQQPQQQTAPAFGAGSAGGSAGFQFGTSSATDGGGTAPFKFGAASAAGGGGTGFSFGQLNSRGPGGSAASGPFSFSAGSSGGGGSGAFVPPSASGGESLKLGRKILPQPKARKRLPMPPR